MNKEIKELLEHLHSYDKMVERNKNLSYPTASVQALMEEVEEPIKVFNVIQTSNVDGQILVNVTPCADVHSAKAIMDEEIRTLLSEGKYEGLRDELSFYLECVYDDYYERIEIEEKELKTI